jgi:putative two-component system response regulator
MSDTRLLDARILVIDDEPAMTGVVSKLLGRAGYHNVESCNDARAAPGMFTSFRPDLVVLDLHMPGIGGFQVLELLALGVPERSYVPVLVLTGDLSREARERALSLGAKDLLTKPFDNVEALLRIRNLLSTRFLALDLQSERDLLEERVAARTADLEERSRELESAHLETLERLARAAEFRDDDTGDHTRRVGDLAGRLATMLGLGADRAALIRRAAPLHDIGKIGVPDHILLKPGSLTADERETMEAHTTIGAQILSGSRSELLHLAESIVLTHHERWDGHGYPWGLRGEGIPIEGRIVSVVDFFDALVHDRPYRRALETERVLDMIREETGVRFDPRVAEAFIELVSDDVSAAAATHAGDDGRATNVGATRSAAAAQTVLLVDDRAAMRSFIRRVLERDGYQVVEAGSPATAIDIAASASPPVDLLLTDIVMPGLDGRALAARVTADRPGTRVLFMSGYSPGELPELDFEPVQAELLQKPFTPDQLTRVVRSVLDAG